MQVQQFKISISFPELVIMNSSSPKVATPQICSLVKIVFATVNEMFCANICERDEKVMVGLRSMHLEELRSDIFDELRFLMSTDI